VKERLTGAIILVTLIVLLVPELLSGPKGPASFAPARAAPTSSEEPPLRSYTINLGDESHSRTASAGSSGPAMPQPSGPEQPATPPGAPQSGAAQPGTPEQAAAQSQAAQAPATPTSQPPPPRAAQSPAATQKPATAQKPSAPARPATARSEVPKPSRTAAATEKQAKAHPATAPAANTESGWAVQLGVFASRDNAEHLVLNLRSKGFKASVSPLTSGGRRLFRVRVGPTADRSAAQELQGRLKAAGRPGGTVVPYS
jgi:cell division septation protein DedD